MLATAPLLFAACLGPSDTIQGDDVGGVDDCAEVPGQTLAPSCESIEPERDETPPDPPGCPSVGGIAYERPHPNVMLLVDRSGSMNEPGACAAATCGSKWSQLLSLGSYLGAVKQFARLGLSVFPSEGGDGCHVSSGLMVPITDASNVDQRILGVVQSMGADGRTPISQALDEAALNGGLDATDRDNIIVLLTDGTPNCACAGDAVCEQEQAVEAVRRLVNRDIPIRLYVVGFGASAAVAGETLSAMAEAAGTALPGPVKYHQADRIEDLIGRLFELAADLAPCRFNLDELPEPADLTVHLDDGLVAACSTEPCTSGYTYDVDAGVVELQGASCQAVRDGACHSVWFDTASSE
ncbi:MAG: vWA domain-containing protein [Deltaproteobacteria bacterium]|nr:vWA domain-containing protein [Deltaproteobacteria bacterium]